MAADVERRKTHAAADVERAHALRCVELMRREREQIAAERGVRFAEPTSGQVVPLRAAGEKPDLVGARAYKRRHFAPRTIKRGARLLPVEVHARSVAELLRQVRQHRFDHTRVNRRRRTVIEIDSAHKNKLLAVSHKLWTTDELS